MGKSVLGTFLSDILYQRRMSNRALATGAGVSEAVVRNLLQHGSDQTAKDPDPRTLRAVGDYLGIDSLKMFRLAGYVDEEPSYSARAEYVASLFDQMPRAKQLAALHVLETLLDNPDAQHGLQTMRENPDDPFAGTELIPYAKGWSPTTRLMANSVLTGQRYIDVTDMPKIDVDTEIWNGRKISDLTPETQEVLLDLIRAKLALDFDTGMKGFNWK